MNILPGRSSINEFHWINSLSYIKENIVYLIHTYIFSYFKLISIFKNMIKWNKKKRIYKKNCYTNLWVMKTVYHFGISKSFFYSSWLSLENIAYAYGNYSNILIALIILASTLSFDFFVLKTFANTFNI